MSISIFQHLILFAIKFVVFILWAIDSIAYWVNYKKRRLLVVNFLYGVAFFLIFNSLVLSASGLPQLRKNANLVSSHLTYQLHPTPSTSTPDKVLGTTVAKIKKPVLKTKSAFPFVSAKAHVIVDKPTGIIISEHNSSRTFAPASTTKLLTALVALDLYAPDQYLEVSEECTQIDTTRAWLAPQEKYMASDLVASLLIGSAGDSGCVLANNAVSQDEFVRLMNQKALAFGMTNSNFTNPIGLDGENGSHYSSAWDLYLLSKRAMQLEIIKEFVKTTDYYFESESGSGLNVTNTNRLLQEIPNSVGVKTGTTEGAGEVLVYEYDDGEDINLLMVVLGSDDRFDDTKKMLEWILNGYAWE